MAFEWQNTLEGKIEAQDINEIKNNVNSLASSLGLNLSWSDTIASGELIKKSTLQEIQNNIDYIDNNKQCLNDCSSNYNNINSIDNSLIYNNQCNAYDGNDYVTVDSDNNITVDDTDNSDIKSDRYSEDFNTYDSGVDSSNYVTIYDIYNSTVDSDDNGTVDATNNTKINTGVNSGLCNTDFSSVLSSYETSFCDAYNSTVDDLDKSTIYNSEDQTVDATQDTGIDNPQNYGHHLQLKDGINSSNHTSQ